MKKFFQIASILILLALVTGSGTYLYLSKQEMSVDYSSYLPGKVFVAFYGAGIEKGRFYSDGTYVKITDLEYVPNDTRSNEHKGTWSSGPNVIVFDRGTDTETLIAITPVRLKERVLLVDPRLVAGDGGYVIGDSLSDIFLYIHAAAPQWSSVERSVIELGPNGR